MTNRGIGMESLLRVAGLLSGVSGVVLMLLATIVRIQGRFSLGGFSASALFLAGVGVVVAGCFFLLWALSVRRP